MATPDVELFQNHVGARLSEFFNRRTPWHRGLWSPGLALTLKETLEASEAASSGVLSEAALHYLVSTAIRLIGQDPGAGSARQKRLLQQSLKAGLRFRGVDYRTIEQLVRDIEDNYLDRWATALADPATCPGPERAARAVASHLLDAGLSFDFLQRWWTFNVRKKGVGALAKLIRAAHGLAREPPRRFRVLVAFAAVPAGKSGMPPHWVDAPAVSEWLRANGFGVSNIRQNGGVWFSVTACDPWAAVELALEAIDRIGARIAIGTDGQLAPLQVAWVDGQQRPFRLQRHRRGVEVHALYREDQLYAEGSTSNVDSAIELLGPLASSGSPAAAVAGGWAAIEALLTGPGDTERVSAGDRMASLVACSFPRAELTALSYKVERVGGALGVRLNACKSNRDRSAVVAIAIKRGEDLGVQDHSDRAAVARLQAVLMDPYQELHGIQDHVASGFRRLYRQRNIVLHWGRTDAVALRASLRTASPLVGAGMDRIAHAWFVDKVTPLELAARAKIRLEKVAHDEKETCVDLLN
jgi:hypothetical protein